MKIRTKLEFLQRLAPKRAATGQLYRNKKQLKLRYKSISMYTLLVSSQNTHLIHEVVFNKEKSKSGAQWAAWFSALVNGKDGSQKEPRNTNRFEYIYVKSVLSGIGLRTEKQWSVQKILGWVGHAKHAPVSSKMGIKRNKTKRQRIKDG